jgi:hypothetical protein
MPPMLTCLHESAHAAAHLAIGGTRIVEVIAHADGTGVCRYRSKGPVNVRTHLAGPVAEALAENGLDWWPEVLTVNRRQPDIARAIAAVGIDRGLSIAWGGRAVW